VSVAEKLVDPVKSCVRNPDPNTCDQNYVPGGYEPNTLAFTPQMSQAMTYVDGAIGSMVDDLGRRGLMGRTQINHHCQTRPVADQPCRSGENR
jgi:hypothetical protein